MTGDIRISGMSNESSAYDFSMYYDIEQSAESRAYMSKYPLEHFDRPITTRNRPAGRVTRPTMNGAVRRTTTDSRTGAMPRAAKQAVKTDVRTKINPALIIRFVAMGTLAALVITMLVVSQVKSHELTRSIQEKQNALTALQQEYDIMMDTFKTEMSESAIEEYAIDNFGMQKCESSQTEYVSLDSEEHFEFGAETRSTWTAHSEGN